MALLAKISLCGDGGVGKTSLRDRYLGRGFDTDYIPTIGADFVSKQVILNHGDEYKKIRFQIWDLAGQPTYNIVRVLYYKHTVGAFLVYDITRPDTLFSLDKWMNELSKHSGSTDISIIVLGNKSDLEDETKDKVKSEEARKYISGELIAKFDNINENVIYLETSAKTGKNVDKAFKSLLENWGGMDILVNAAGIAPPYSLTELPVGKWRQALEVNLTGYFLMARAAAKIMIRQGMGGNIINISSKSGLEASKDNTAYNATKAGEIHMTRGWAHELGEYGIRVNCLAPGNVFEGSKIWNPEYIRICARKYGIKPEEVIPYYVKRTALKREIKGQDIADAVIFLCSEKARTITGQTLVADSGQVMVR